MTKNIKKPAVRFKEFTDAWEQRKLGDVTDSYSGGTPSVGVKEYYNGDIPFIRSAEINSDSTELFITESGLNNSSARYVNKGDILYALYGATSGEVSISKLKGAINQAILSIKPNEGYVSEFIMQWLKNQKENIISTYLQGGQGNLSGSIVKALKVDVTTYAEQQKIGTYFKNLDNLITLHQRKCDTLQKLKKSMLQKMFPQNDKSVPEFRFEGFTDAWEQRELGEHLIKNNERNKELTISNVESVSNKKGFVKQTEQFEDYSVASSDLSNYYIIRENMFAYNPSRINVGSIAYKEKGDDIAVVSPLYVSFATKNIDDKYLWYWFKTSSFEQQRQVSSEGGVRDTLSFDKVNSMQIALPSVAEQQQIGSYFRNLDNLITLHQRKLETLKKLKKSMLQKMFV